MAISVERGQSIFRKTEKELLRLSRDHGVEVIHGFRTATRRLQTLLQQLVDEDGKHKKLLKMLNRIRKSAGRVRDIDVQVEALRSLKVLEEPRRKTQLMQSLFALRAQHVKKLLKLLKKQDLRDIRKRLKRTERSVQFDSCRDPLALAKQILSSVPVPKGQPDEETLHSYRLVVKRARYAAEFAPKSAEATKFLGELKQLQDALGSWHDWITLTHTAMERLGGVGESSLVAVLHNVTRAKFRQAVSAVTAAKIVPHTAQPSAVELPAARKMARKESAAERSSGAAA